MHSEWDDVFGALQTSEKWINGSQVQFPLGYLMAISPADRKSDKRLMLTVQLQPRGNIKFASPKFEILASDHSVVSSVPDHVIRNDGADITEDFCLRHELIAGNRAAGFRLVLFSERNLPPIFVLRAPQFTAGTEKAVYEPLFAFKLNETRHGYCLVDP